MKGYKGFNKDLTCRGKQYAENTVFEEETAEICKSGMHFCEDPFEVLFYYGFVNDNAEINEFAEVEALDDCKTDDNKKYATTKLKIGAKIGISGLIKAFVGFTLSRVKTEDASTNTGDYSASTNTGDYSASTNTGRCSVSTNTGFQSTSTNTGNYSASMNTGFQSTSTNTGNYSASMNTGRCSISTNTGDHSVSTSTGNCSISTNNGYRSASTSTGNCSISINNGYRSASSVEGRNSFAIATGNGGRAKGKLGCYIAVAEWKQKDNGEYDLINFRTHKVDGKTIKEDTYYMLKNGKFVEYKDC